MSRLKPDTTYIYERDGGTVYAREMGADPSTRIEIGYDYPAESGVYHSPTREKMLEDQLWHEIRATAKTNPALQAELDRVIMLYYLIKEEEKSIFHHSV